MAGQGKKDVAFEPIVTRRASEAIYEQIRDKIIRGDLKPGDRLPSERNLIEMFQRSRPTIREALRMLENSGLIKIIPGSGGAIINELNTESVEHPLENMIALRQIDSGELYEFRAMMEVTYCGWAAKRRTEQDLEALRGILAKSEESMGELDRFLELDISFHRTLALASKNTLSGIVDSVLSRVFYEALRRSITSQPEKVRQFRCRDILETHREIYNAIADGDEDEAKLCIQRHLERFHQDITV